ncbi:GNAT family N-acetyltransferase [Peribacillus sp. SCS-155]|uniref:GNAT family N-acetyltransferase n=1 Tax=Peribacillus sedimenti TaxID=3115297 RepID=UPI00390600D2
MNEDFLLKEAAAEDLPRIVEIYNSTIASRMVTADTMPVTVHDRLDWFHGHTSDKRPLYVMDHNGVIAGWMSFQSFYGRPAYDATAEISIYIDTSYRGKGLGKWALNQAMALGPKAGIKTLLGFIFFHNTPSIKLFSQAGFEKWGHLPRVAELDGIERDLVIMGKRIES